MHLVKEKRIRENLPRMIARKSKQPPMGVGRETKKSREYKEKGQSDEKEKAVTKVYNVDLNNSRYYLVKRLSPLKARLYTCNFDCDFSF